MIQNLYESSMKGLLPERQVQRMIQQYDEEQILLERRIGELQEQMKQEEVKKVETERFIALVKKYRDCGEVTDTMLYAFALCLRSSLWVSQASLCNTVLQNF